MQETWGKCVTPQRFQKLKAITGTNEVLKNDLKQPYIPCMLVPAVTVSFFWGLVQYVKFFFPFIPLKEPG